MDILVRLGFVTTLMAVSMGSLLHMLNQLPH